MSRGTDKHVPDRADVVPADAGRTADDLNGGHTRLRQVGKAITLVVEGAPGLGPVLDEGRSQAINRWPFYAEVRVPPLLLVAGVAHPLLSNPHSTGEPDGFVDNAHFAMTTVVLFER